MPYAPRSALGLCSLNLGRFIPPGLCPTPRKTNINYSCQITIFLIGDTPSNGSPWKINMEPTNHPFRKENDLPNPHDSVPC